LGGREMMERAVERGLACRELESLQYAGIDEKSFRRGHSYVSILTDLTGRRVLEVVEDRTEEAADGLWESLTDKQKNQIEAVAVAMWPAFANTIETNVPQAEIVHDRFHISKHLNEAVDQVRRSEHRGLKQVGDERLTGSKPLWLFNPENLSDDRWIEFETLKDQELKTSRAWAIKEQFRWFWEAKPSRRPKREERGLGCGRRTRRAMPANSSINGTAGRHIVDSNRSSKWPRCSSGTSATS